MTPSDLGFLSEQGDASAATADWLSADPIDALLTVGRADMERRDFARQALYSLAALALPLDRWSDMVGRARRARDGATVGRGEVDAVREMVTVFSRADERFGGGHAHAALVGYLTTDAVGYLRGVFRSETDRRDMYAAVAELAYLAGWKSFDSGLHGIAQRYYVQSLKLANEVDDRALAGFTLRAMAHQAVDLGHAQEALRLATSALEWSRGRATPAATALFTILMARGHAATGDGTRTAITIEAAERHLSKASPESEPMWIQTSGFTETSLASQAGQALRDLGDLSGAQTQLRRSIATRDAGAYRRIHTLTLANLADVQFARGELHESLHMWSTALDHMTGLRSARAHEALVNLRRRMRSLGERAPVAARRLDANARDALKAFRGYPTAMSTRPTR